MLEAAHIRTIFIPELMRDVDSGSDLKATKALFILFRKERPHVVHLNSSKAAGLGSFAGRLVRVPHIIFTAHGWPFWEDRSRMRKLMIKILSFLTVLFSHKTICISEHDKNTIAHIPFIKNKVIVIHNGVPKIDYLGRTASRSAFFSSEIQAQHLGDTWMITNAELHPNKNLMFAIDVVRRHNATHTTKIFYVIMGDGEQYKEIPQYIHDQNLGVNIKLLGFVPNARRYMRGFDVFFLPSKKEGLPYVILEAGQAGLAVIASNVGGIPEIIEHNESGLLINPNNFKETSKEIRTLIESPATRTYFGDNLKKVVEAEFRLEIMLKKTIQLYT